MKIRNGFVSNSSSSSFVIIGKEEYIENLSKSDLNTNIIIKGKHLWDGYDVFRLIDNDMLNFIQSNSQYFMAFRGILVYDSKEIPASDIVNLQNKYGKVLIYCETADQNSSNSLKELRERYTIENEE